MSSPAHFKVPLVDLRAQYGGIRDEVRDALDEVNESQQFILGPAVTKFEQQMAAYLQCDQAVGVASGSDALLLAMMALDIGPGDAVITTPLTFFSTVSSITRLGASTDRPSSSAATVIATRFPDPIAPTPAHEGAFANGSDASK